MADEKAPAKDNTYALVKENELPAYPKMIYVETDKKYPNGAPVMKELGKAANPEEHKALLAEYKGAAPAWSKGEK